MSHGKIWAKIVDNEIMQTHDEDPSGLWHPDAIAKNDLPGYWEEVPNYVNSGWKFKNGEWISGGQWLEEHIAENPPPPPGPPCGRIDYTIAVDNITYKAKVLFDIQIGGIWTEFYVDIDGKRYENLTENDYVDLELVFDQGDAPRQVPVTITTIGPGGTHVEDLTDVEIERQLIIQEKWVPLFARQ